MNKKIGFIGCGKMAQAMIGGLIDSNVIGKNQIYVSARSNETLEKVKNLYGVLTLKSNIELAQQVDYLFLAVKPDLYPTIIEEIKEVVSHNTVIITIAAGITLEGVEKSFGKEVKIVRTMPNTPSLVREGMSALCHNHIVTENELNEVMEIFNSFGKCEIVNEKLMDAIPAISGSSPAYVYLMIEALADGAVLQGIQRNQAYKLAAQAVLGAAKMVLETELHPGELKDQVCTPGGATIEAIAELEKQGFRSSIISAMERCTEKSKSLGN
ncbi:pyrroline-5-carboxylate reductase [Bacillus sp. AFS017336]|uniref:pyrroline-5-carboxylate reductase n=1 Tax=Bacillaceae TaxID=186817 RepID=UPI000BF12E8B|nr:pyrroline-5-carboxylate reductase [Bacillus sp. AFS017336]PEL12541.1 pyrroline-5-carboxylate reductase [Bacillus sp. AFS017336]QKE75330.1 pyrroline-5-carboxylate reductase [Arthrobacter citreus]